MLGFNRIKMYIKRKIAYIFVTVTLAFIYWFIGLNFYWYYVDKQNPIEIHSIDFDKKYYDKNDIIEIETMYSLKRTCFGEIHRQFVYEYSGQEKEFIINLKTVRLRQSTVGEYDTVSNIIVPEKIFPGEWIYKTTYIFKCNPVSDIVIDAPDVKFEIREDS